MGVGRAGGRGGPPGVTDVACQIHDWDGDGSPEVVVVGAREMVELDGATGGEKRRLPVPEDAADCVTFVNLSGGERPTEVLIKTRYEQIWALDREGRELWNVRYPAGRLTAHQVFPVDLDGDGRDELIVGYAMLNPDGSRRGEMEAAAELPLGIGCHLDCARVLRRGDSAPDWRFVVTCCANERLAAVDGTGRIVWAEDNRHYESIDVCSVYPELPGRQIVVDVAKHEEVVAQRSAAADPGCRVRSRGRLLACRRAGAARHMSTAAAASAPPAPSREGPAPPANLSQDLGAVRPGSRRPVGVVADELPTTGGVLARASDHQPVVGTDREDAPRAPPALREVDQDRGADVQRRVHGIAGNAHHRALRSVEPMALEPGSAEGEAADPSRIAEQCMPRRSQPDLVAIHETRSGDRSRLPRPHHVAREALVLGSGGLPAAGIRSPCHEMPHFGA